MNEPRTTPGATPGAHPGAGPGAGAGAAGASQVDRAGRRPVVVTRELTKRYGEFTALDRLTLDVREGEILGFIGPNGAGKTTAIKILVGLARPTSGEATIDGVHCTDQSRRVRRMVGYMPDEVGVYDNMRVHEYLDFFAATFGIHGKRRRTRIEEVLELTGSAYMRDKFVESLSHGMRKRVGIARTLLHDPSVLIFDEPANGLDPQARIELRTLLLELARLGKTLIVTSHILPELSRICDRVAIVTSGKLRAFGALDEIMRYVTQRRGFEVLLGDDGHAETARRTVEEVLTESADLTWSAPESVLRFSTTDDDQRIAELLASLVRGGVRVVQLREVQVDLEDAFLTVTQQAAQAGAGQRDAAREQASSPAPSGGGR